MGTTDGYDTVSVVSPGDTLRADFVPDANMLCSSLTHRGDQLLHAAHDVRTYAERGKATGIPLLHPWANRLAAPDYTVGGRRVKLPAPEGHYGTDPNGLPIHGALPGLLRWKVLDTAQSAGERLSARLDWDGPALLELFPFAHELRLEIEAADDRLEIVTTLRPTGDAAVPVSFGYHPYLTLPGTSRVDWQVSLGATQRVVTDDHMIPTGEREPLNERSFRLDDQSFDDGLAGLTTPPEFVVAAGERSLTVTFQDGYRWAQVFAPPGSDFICFEPMTAPTNALRDGRDLRLVAPGDEHRAAFTIAARNI